MSQNTSDDPAVPEWRGPERRGKSEPPEDGIEQAERSGRRADDRRSGHDRRAGGSESMQIADYLRTAEELGSLARELAAGDLLSTEPVTPTVPSKHDTTQDDLDFEPDPSTGPGEQSTQRIIPHTDVELREIVARMVDDILRVAEAGKERRESQLIQRRQEQFSQIRAHSKEIFSAVAGIALLVAAQLAWTYWPRDTEIPDGMIGMWTTTAPRYEDRAFRLTKSTVTFHVSEQDSTFHDIVRVRRRDDPHATRYMIFYTHFGVEYEFPFFYSEQPDTTIQLLHQREMTWRKRAGGQADRRADGQYRPPAGMSGRAAGARREGSRGEVGPP